ncbi:hypothetical protein EGW08_006309 [Elysia chlorotica]|uniref:Cap-specific mRNA (nucleoside-2'-O-)-methyltransferase 2 n=1 Tax=Elysia chlorotica TaxID=188477 RepID=A0A3S1HTL8_ELYCH|nr:hypothetical protein EGW08_006309 [Elysia chlorotica]
MRLKEEMNSVKDQLSSKDIQTWHAHTTQCNLAANVIPHVKGLDVELCTQAWVKFYEILNAFHGKGLVPDDQFMSVHLCEAPGAFVTALNHFLQQKGFQHMWDWRATTLNPYHESNCLGEMIADDRLIRQTYIQWFFGEDGSGDITHPSHVRGLRDMLAEAAEYEELQVRLVTTDGSKDCQVNPAEQEGLVSRLHHCEALTAALVLAPGGALVIKVFTLFETSSVLLMFLLNLMFNEVHTMKPATSKSGNSELYVVCLGYRQNVKEETLWAMLDLTVYNNTDEKTTLRLTQSLPTEFMEEHRRCCHLFAQYQLETIHTNLRLYETMTEEERQQLELKQRLALDFFLQRTGLGGRSRKHRWVAGYRREKSAFFFPQPSFAESNFPVQSFPQCGNAGGARSKLALNHPHQRQTGTFQLRQNLSTMSWPERLRLMDYRDATVPRITELQTRGPLQDCELDEWTEVDTGQAFSAILTSRLCDVSQLNDLNLMLENSDYERCRQWRFMDHARWIGQTAAQLLVDNSSSTTPLPGPSSLPPSCSELPSPHSEQSGSCQVYYWDRGRRGEDEKSSPLYESFSEALLDSRNVTVVDGDPDTEIKTAGPVLVFCNLTSFCDPQFKSAWRSRFEELLCRAKCVQRVAAILKKLTTGSDLVLLAPTSLTRLTSSLMYILARCFGSIVIDSSPNLWMHQLIKLRSFLGVGSGLLSHLLDIGQRLGLEVDTGQTQACLMEVVSFPVVVCDRKFVQLITAHNNRSVAGFLNLMLDHTRGVSGHAGQTKTQSESESIQDWPRLL